MENLILLLTASLVLYKSSKKYKKILIGDTPCSVHFSPEASFDHTKSEDGDDLYFSEHVEKGITYGILCAQLVETLPLEEAEDVTTAYLGRLRKPFYALHSTGITPCPVYKGTSAIIRLEDYWQDQDGCDWKVKAYTDGATIAVLYVKNIAEGETEKHDAFLNSFSFGKLIN
jgi:hypothetical protein